MISENWYKHADPAPAVQYAPAENLEQIDVGLINIARHEIDLAAYVLTDWPIIQARTRAADRGDKVRISLDGTQLAERRPRRSSVTLRDAGGRDTHQTRPRRDSVLI